MVDYPIQTQESGLGNSPLNSELNFSLFTIQNLTPLLISIISDGKKA